MMSTGARGAPQQTPSTAPGHATGCDGRLYDVYDRLGGVSCKCGASGRECP